MLYLFVLEDVVFDQEAIPVFKGCYKDTPENLEILAKKIKDVGGYVLKGEVVLNEQNPSNPPDKYYGSYNPRTYP